MASENNEVAFPTLDAKDLAALTARRVLLLGEDFVGVTIVGSRFSPDAHRLRDFATRNGVPVKWMDLEADEQADALLRQFNIPASATPIVLGSDGEWVSNPLSFRPPPPESDACCEKSGRCRPKCRADRDKWYARL